jgi:rhodanese-related sulfurtransferase
MPVPEIDVQEHAALRESGATLLDVRTPGEYEEFHVPGSVLIPLDELAERVEEVPEVDRVYVICRTGARSARAVEFLNRTGYDTVTVVGGCLAWVEAGQPVVSGAELE